MSSSIAASPFVLDFDGSEEAAAMGIALGSTSTTGADPGGEPGKVLQVCLPGLDDVQLASLNEMKRHLINLPPLDGSIFPRPDTLALYGSIKSYLMSNLCPHPEADFKMNLRALVSILSDDREFGKSASPAAVASAVVSLEWSDPATWIVGNPLQKWVVHAAFYEVHKPRDLLSPVDNVLLRQVIAATRELHLEPVCRRGFCRILPVLDAYVQLIRAGARTVLKVAHEGTPELFFVRQHARHLYAATLADMTDGMSLPLAGKSPEPFDVQWPKEVLRDIHDDAGSKDISEETKDFIASVSARYCWAVVSVCKISFPSFNPDAGTWCDVNVLFPE
jgi:hypothetical protein